MRSQEMSLPPAVVTDGEGEVRPWDELPPDILGIVSKGLRVEEILTSMTLVCKSWNKVITGPYCWQEFNLILRKVPDGLLRTLITRSSGSLRKLTVCNLEDDATFSFLADHASRLHTLELPFSDISDDILFDVAHKFSSLTVLNLSFCDVVTFCGLEAIGKHCKFLQHFGRNRVPVECSQDFEDHDISESYAIANTMGNLRRLKMCNNITSTEAFLKILSSCPLLELVDIRGCWGLDLDLKFISESYPNLYLVQGGQVQTVYNYGGSAETDMALPSVDELLDFQNKLAEGIDREEIALFCKLFAEIPLT